MEIIFFKDQSEFREWLAANHNSKSELEVGFYKKDSGKQNMTWSEAVDQALCYGWIDGVKHTIDEISYRIRFTPRKVKSNWSDVNLKKMEVLIDTGQMHPAGLEIYNKRIVNNSNQYSYENKPEKLSPELEAVFLKEVDAWTFFNEQSNTYKKTIFYWIMSAKQDQTKYSRLAKVIEQSKSFKKLQ